MRRLALLAVLIAALSATGWTAASFSAATKSNPGNSLTAQTLAPASGPTASASGHDIALAWTAAPFATSYTVAGGGGNSTCSSVTYATLGTPTAASYTDAGRYTPQGTWRCYRVNTTYRSFTSLTGDPVVGVRIGFVVTSVALSASGALPGSLDAGDTIVIGFNQPVSVGSRPAATSTVCARDSNDTVYLASTTTTGVCTAGEAVEVGTLGGLAVTASSNPRWAATYTWNAAGTQLTITIGNRTQGPADAVVGVGALTFAPTTATASLQSATGGFHVCDTNAGGGDCLPASTGGF
jgi:hypothetical protein